MTAQPLQADAFSSMIFVDGHQIEIPANPNSRRYVLLGFSYLTGRYSYRSLHFRKPMARMFANLDKVLTNKSFDEYSLYDLKTKKVVHP